jgi:NAD(P)-dependent dehydrogenase (short-subunit alcohol dehydrogenase family)
MAIMILGCNGRIGKSLTLELFKQNHELILVDKIISKELEKKLKKYKKQNFYLEKIDLNNEKSIQKLLEKVKKNNKTLDAVINCIYPADKYWGKYDLKDINKKILDRHFSNHLSNLIIITKHLTNFFIKQKKGNLIFLSSIQGLGAPKFEHYQNTSMRSPIEYSIIKSGIINMTKYLAKYFKGKNIRFNCISPGGIRDNQPKTFIKKYKESCLSKGLLDSEDLLSAFKFLISEESKYVNGQNIIIDDGWSL